MDRVKEAAALRPDKNIAILLDTKGPEIRTGFFSEKCKGKIHLKAGATVELTTDYTFKGDETKFACTYDKLPTSVWVPRFVLASSVRSARARSTSR